jgi:hypothetical protein
MSGIEKVIGVFVVNFDEGNRKLESVLFRSSLEFFKNVAQHSWNNASVRPKISSAHGIGLPRSGLSIGKDGAVVTVKAVIDDRLGDSLKHIFLGRSLRENLMEGELMVFLGIGKLRARNL